YFFFFFQAEDGIRDPLVTGVQTCALPIWLKNEVGAEIDRHKIVLERPIKDTGEHEVAIKLHHDVTAQLVFQVKSAAAARADTTRSEERRVGKECRSTG